MAVNLKTSKENETQIRQLVENWAKAVRNKDIAAILANHSNDIVMYDVPKPFQSVGIDAYRKTWDTFFAFTKPGVFNIQELHIVADENVAFCFATMKCADKSNGVEFVDLDFRLTIGLQKINDQWTIIHEHHSIPSE
ncbi:MAG TPA: nuclear transport factor 2 family protein [Chitinophagaceae bacterium]|jgi:ketosteroid isomerase-like protein|nr:nuclear transport factor 2 family protein [Chitinophagaceae bacterium]